MKRLPLSALATAVVLALSTPSVAISQTAMNDDAAALSRTLGIAMERLADVRASSETLLDGREMRIVKAVDAATGETVGQAFSAGIPVDPQIPNGAQSKTWDALEYGPEAGTYKAKLNFVVAGTWAVAVRFRRDSLHPLERTDWMQDVSNERDTSFGK